MDSTVHDLFPDHELTWERFEGDLDVPDLGENKEKDKEEEEIKKLEQERELQKKDKRFQAVDSACSGLLFFRFRINIKPTEFVTKLIDQKDQVDQTKLKYCSVSIAHVIGNLLSRYIVNRLLSVCYIAIYPYRLHLSRYYGSYD